MQALPLIRYRHLPLGIHEFVLLNKSRAGVDALFAKIGAAFDTYPPEATVTYLIDFSEVGVPSASYLYHAAMRWGEEHPNAARGRGAILYRPDPLLVLGVSVVQLLERTWYDKITLKMFKADQRQLALE